MKKTTFTKLLALAVAVIVIAASLTAGFGAFAAGTTTVKGNTVYDEPFDLDFSNGLTSWAGIGSPAKFVAENGVLKASDAFNTPWDEIGPARFKVPNVQVGDTIKFSFDLAINTDLGDQALTDRVNSGERILWPLFRQYNAAGDKIDEETLDVTKNHAGTVVSKAFTVADPDEFYRIIIRSANSLKNSWGISNITVTVTHVDGSVDTYPAPAGGETPPAGGETPPAGGETPPAGGETPPAGGETPPAGGETPPAGGETPPAGGETPPAGGETPPAGTTTPNYYGTADKGFDSGTNANYRLKPVDGVKNLDFSEGFTYWSGRNGGGNDAFASDAFDLVTEGNNKYVKVKETGWVTSIRSAVFAVEGINAGDKISILYDVKGADGATFHIKLTQVVLKDGVVYDATTGVTADTGCATGEYIMVGSGIKASDFKWNLGGEGWTTRAGYWNNTLVQERPEGADQKLYFQIVITSDAGGAQAGDKLDAAIDNLRLVKIVDGVYYNALTGAEITETSDGSTTGGSTTGGSTTGGSTGGSTTGAGSTSGTSKPTGDSVLMLAALFFISGAAVFGTAKALKKSR